MLVYEKRTLILRDYILSVPDMKTASRDLPQADIKVLEEYFRAGQWDLLKETLPKIPFGNTGQVRCCLILDLELKPIPWKKRHIVRRIPKFISMDYTEKYLRKVHFLYKGNVKSAYPRSIHHPHPAGYKDDSGLAEVLLKRLMFPETCPQVNSWRAGKWCLDMWTWISLWMSRDVQKLLST